MPRQLDPTDPLARETAAERERLADLHAVLTPDQWSAPSLCEGWRVREVLAHVTMPYRHSAVRVLRGIAAARGDFDRFADRIARHDTSRLSDAELLTALRDNISHPWQPPRGGRGGALSHDVIHGLDVTEALGLARPPGRPRPAGPRRRGPRAFAYFGTDLTGVRLVATDAEFAVGDGPETVEMPAADVLLRVTGRVGSHSSSPRGSGEDRH